LNDTEEPRESDGIQ